MVDRDRRILFGPLLDERFLREAVEHERRVDFWGRRHTIHPRLVDEKFGDGLGLITFTPLNTRPNYYVVRVDSSLVLNEDCEDTGLSSHAFYDDVLPLIYEAIEEQFGNVYWSRDEEDGDPEAELYPWPALDDGAGAGWGSLWASSLLAEHARWLLFGKTPPRRRRPWGWQRAFLAVDHARRVAARRARGLELLMWRGPSEAPVDAARVEVRRD